MAKLMARMRAFHVGDHVNMKAFMLMLAGFVFLAFLISFFIVFINIRNRQAVEKDLMEQASFAESLDSSLDSLRLGDFLLPEQSGGRQKVPLFQREPQRGWSTEEIEKYWIDLEDTGVGEIGEYNKKMIADMLEGVP